jgi:hypothetical protein
VTFFHHVRAPSKERLGLHDPCRGEKKRLARALLEMPAQSNVSGKEIPMEDFEKLAGNRSSASIPQGDRSPAPVPRSERPGRGEAKDASTDSIWKELRLRREKAGRRIGEGWERASENAKRYADDHSIGVALGSLGVGVALGILIGAVAAKD